MRSDNTRQRLLTVLDFLKQYSDSGHPQSTGEILTELKKYGIESERKAIYRDIEALREFGFDIRLTGTPKRGYYIASRDFELPEVSLLLNLLNSNFSYNDLKNIGTKHNSIFAVKRKCSTIRTSLGKTICNLY